MPRDEQDLRLRVEIESLLERMRELVAEAEALRSRSMGLRVRAREVSARLS